MTLDAILDEIKKAETIVILAHESPDGDAVARWPRSGACARRRRSQAQARQPSRPARRRIS